MVFMLNQNLATKHWNYLLIVYILQFRDACSPQKRCKMYLLVVSLTEIVLNLQNETQYVNDLSNKSPIFSQQKTKNFSSPEI